MNEKMMRDIAFDRFIQIFGQEYLRCVYSKITISNGFANDGIYQVACLIYGEEEYPMDSNYYGWTVYAIVRIDQNTGKIVYEKYQTEK